MKNRQSAIGNRQSGVSRREAVEMLGVGSLAAYGVGSPSWERFHALEAGGQQAMRFFTAAEEALMRVLADMIIPRDEKSGSATDAGAIEYMDFVLSENSDRARQQWHDGLKWFDDECGRRFQKAFVACSDAERGQVLDDIAWPARASAERRDQATFFNRVRDLTASAFFSSRMGVTDIGYIGNVFNPQWRGAPDEALRELGLSYEEWDRKYGGHR